MCFCLSFNHVLLELAYSKHKLPLEFKASKKVVASSRSSAFTFSFRFSSWIFPFGSFSRSSSHPYWMYELILSDKKNTTSKPVWQFPAKIIKAVLSAGNSQHVNYGQKRNWDLMEKDHILQSLIVLFLILTAVSRKTFPLFSGLALFYAIWFEVSTIKILTNNNTQFLFALHI